MTRIGLIGDTHYPEAGPLWDEAYARLDGADLILHTGDLHVIDVLDWLEARCGAPVLGVRGNGDDGGGGRPACPEDPRLRPAHVLDVEGLRIGLVHDATLPEWPPHRTLETIMRHEFGGPVDVLVHGHTHVPEIEELRGVLLVNPGSPTFPRNMARSHGTIGFLDIDGARAHAWVEQLPHGERVAEGER
ncbi:MAG: YfcE family phosphodiesterase [Chloroflexota bacterium]|nr:YfcE family phosphodiesterase [Chloroflexota bacterium]